jgi:glycerol kinase
VADVILAIDQGGQSTRAIAYDADGRQLGDASEEVSTEHPAPGRYEQDPELLVRSVRSVVTRLLETLPDHAVPVGAGLATQRSSAVCWDRETGQPLSPILSWRDRRNAAWLRSLDLDPIRVHRVTGLRSSPHYGAAKLRWCLDHIPAVSAAMNQGRLVFGPMASFLIYRMTRERTLAADPVNASRTLLMDIGSCSWSERMLDEFGISRELLPPVATGETLLGTLDLDGPAIPLRLCTGDQAAALFAGGQPDPSLALVNAGTGAFALQKADWPNGEQRLLTSVIRAVDRHLEFALEGTVNGAATALEAEAENLGVDDWRSLLGAAAKSDQIPVFLNGYSGLGSPWWQESFPSGYEGPGSPAARLTAVMESIVFMLQVNLAAIRHRVPSQTGIRLGGGLSRLDGLCQRLADLSRLPVERPAQTEATARGLAWLAFRHERDWSLPGARIFEPRANTVLDGRFERWQLAMDRVLGRDNV